MLLKILLLQVMSIGLITVPIKAQDTLSELPDLYMEESDKAVMNSIWNMAGFPSDQNGASEVDRKFFATLGHVVPVLQQPIVQQIPMVHSAIVPGTINSIGPGYTTSVSPGYATSVVPAVAGMVPAMPTLHQQQFNDNKQDKQIHQAGGSYSGSPTTINYKVLPKPPNSELDSSEEDDLPEVIRRALHLENVDLEIAGDNDKETKAGYYPSENLESDLDSTNLVMERMDRMMQFEGANENIMNNKPRNFLRRKNMNDGIQSHDTDTDNEIRSGTRKNSNPPDEDSGTMNRNSHTGMHKKKHNRKPDSVSGNSETSTSLPTAANQKFPGKWKEPMRKSNKTPDTRKYYEMLDNNQKYLCQCDILSDEAMKGTRSRRRNQELNDWNSYAARSLDIRHERPFNCTKYCSVTEENADKTRDKDDLRLRSRRNKGIYHKDIRNDVDDDSAEKESVGTKATTHSRKYRNKHTMYSYVDDSNYRAMRDVNPSDYVAGSVAEVLDSVEGSMMRQYPKANMIHYETLKML